MSELFIECTKCGNSESQPSDQQRHHVQNFVLVALPSEKGEEDDGNAHYECNCGNVVRSKIVPCEHEPTDSEEKHWNDMATYNERFSPSCDDDYDYDDY